MQVRGRAKETWVFVAKVKMRRASSILGPLEINVIVQRAEFKKPSVIHSLALPQRYLLLPLRPPAGGRGNSRVTPSSFLTISAGVD